LDPSSGGRRPGGVDDEPGADVAEDAGGVVGVGEGGELGAVPVQGEAGPRRHLPLDEARHLRDQEQLAARRGGGGGSHAGANGE